MKNSPSIKTSLRLLVLAGALAPLASYSVTLYDEGSFYDNLRLIQASSVVIGAMHGAQGPVRSEFSEPLFSYEEGGFYDNLKRIQQSPSSMKSMSGAQGPVRNDFMQPAWSYDEGAFYDNLRNITATN